METTNLLKVSSYAKKKKVSVQWVYKLIEKGKVESVVIDGIQFVKIN